MSEFEEVKSLVREAIEYKKEKEYEKAREILEEGQEKYPENNYLLASLSDTYLRLNQLSQAQQLADQVLADKPDYAPALLARGNIAYKNMDYQKAEKFFRQAQQQQESSYTAARLIRTLLKQAKNEEALDLCQKKLEENPDHEKLKKMKAEIYEKLNKTEEAKELLTDYLANTDDNFAFKKKLKLKIKEMEPQQAINELKNLLRLDKYADNTAVLTLLAEQFADQEKYEQAAEIFQQALELEPDNHYIRKNLGLSLHNCEKWEEALPYLKESCREEPGDYYLRNTLQYAFRQLEMHQEGMDFFRKLINETGLNNIWGAYNRLKKEVEQDEN